MDTLSPKQMLLLVALMLSTGGPELTDTDMALDAVQFKLLVPVTE